MKVIDMFTRQDLLAQMRCKCDQILNEYELDNFEQFDGLCEDCYTEAMSAAYDDYNPTRTDRRYNGDNLEEDEFNQD